MLDSNNYDSSCFVYKEDPVCILSMELFEWKIFLLLH